MPHKLIRAALRVISAAFLLLVLLPAAVFAQGDVVPRFEPSACPPGLPDSVRCGYLVVLEDRADPGGRTIRLPVAIFASRAETPAPDPVVYLEGGPGGSAFAWISGWIDNAFLERRDFIVLEQRGTAYAEPALNCPEVSRELFDGFTMALSPEEESARQVQAASVCRDRLVEQGIDLAAYHSSASAADLNDLRQVLGYESWNLYGISYGTRLALWAMREQPQGIRSVILDSTYPPQVDNYVDTVPGYTAALERLFAACAEDAACNAAYPDLEAAFYRVIERMNANPARVHTIHLFTGEPVDLLLTGDDFASGIFVSMYSRWTIPYLPFVIDQADQGNAAVLLPLVQDGLSMLLGAITWGMNYSVECHDEAPLDPDAIAATANEYPLLRGFMTVRSNAEICGVWGAGEQGTSADEPVRGDIPTLVLAGEFDPTTPHEWGEETAGYLDNAYYYLFPGLGHAPTATTACGRNMAVAFVDDPGAGPDASCMADVRRLPFVLDADVYVTPALYRLNAEFLTLRDPAQMGLLAFGLIFLLVEVLMWPAALLRRLIRRGTPQETLPRPARIARLLAGLAAVLCLGFLIALVLIVRQLYAADPILLGFGVPASVGPLFLVPILTAALTLALIVFAVIAWKNRWWSAVGRVHYTLVAAAALCLTIWMATWNLL